MGREPSDQQLMEEALLVARNASTEVKLRVDALTALRYLVEPIDNALGQFQGNKNWHKSLFVMYEMYSWLSKEAGPYIYASLIMLPSYETLILRPFTSRFGDMALYIICS